MSGLNETEAQFRLLTQEIIDKYEEELRTLNEEQERRKAKLEKDEAETRNILSASGANLDAAHQHGTKNPCPSPLPAGRRPSS